jgi:hypothetical protein
MASDEQSGWGNWVNVDGFAHPDSPAGGGGPGHFRIPGPLGLNDVPDGVPHPGSRAGRHSDLQALENAHKEHQADAAIARLLGADRWQHLKLGAEILLGPKSFGLGVCVGIVKNPLTAVAGLLELQKVFILADLYDRIERPGSWTSFIPGFGAGSVFALGAAGLMAMGAIKREDLRQAHDQREQLKRELAEVLAHPLDYLATLPAQIRDEYAGKWSRFLALSKQSDIASQFEAGEILGDCLVDVVTTIAGVVSGVGTAAKVASKVPQLMKTARLFKARSGGAAKTVGVERGAAVGLPTGPPAVRRIPVSGARLEAPHDGALHNQDWESIQVREFKAERSQPLDPEALSPSDESAWKVLKKQGYSDGKRKEILNSGENFRLRLFKEGEPMYAFDSADFSGKAADSPYWMDRETFESMQLQFKNGELWNRQGVKDHLALPCFNKADGIVQGQVTETHVGVESTVGKATENVTYQAKDGTVVPRAKSMPGGGKQVTPGAGKVAPARAK